MLEPEDGCESSTPRRKKLDENDHEPDARPIAHYGRHQRCLRAGARKEREEEEEKEGRGREEAPAQRQHPLSVPWFLRNWPRLSRLQVVWRGLIFLLLKRVSRAADD